MIMLWGKFQKSANQEFKSAMQANDLKKLHRYAISYRLVLTIDGEMKAGFQTEQKDQI